MWLTFVQHCAVDWFVKWLVNWLADWLLSYEIMNLCLIITWKNLLLLLFCFNFFLFVSMHENLLDLSVFREPMVTVTPSHSWSVCCNVFKRQCIFLLIIATFFATTAKYEYVTYTYICIYYINRNVSRFSTQ